MINSKIYLNADKRGFSYNKRDYLIRATQQMGWKVFDDIANAVGGDIDYLLNIQPCDIKRGKKWTGLWHIDVSMDSSLPQHYGEMDTVFVASSVGKTHYDKEIVMFQACDPFLHRRIPEISQDYDFVVCGTGGTTEGLYAERGRVIKLLSSKYTYLDGGNGLEPEFYVREYNKAKVQVVQPTTWNGYGMCAQRFFECLAIGPVLCDYTPDLELLGLVEGGDYFSYKTDEEMFTKMDLLLGSEELRNKMFLSGREQALKNHTFAHRLITIFNTVNEHISRTAS